MLCTCGMLARKTRCVHRSVRRALVIIGTAAILASAYLLFTSPRHRVPPDWTSNDGLHNRDDVRHTTRAAGAVAAYGRTNRNGSVGSSSSSSSSTLAELIARINTEQTLRNAERLGFRLADDGIVFVVQVHDRDVYLRQTIESMRQVDGIAGVLVVFSHDYYSERIFDVVQQIDFMPVLQIFYPSAMQLFPDRFPGADPKDCPRDISKNLAVASGCLNAQHPDKYGHYREARYVQTKHHWFWKLNRVYDFLDVTKSFHGTVVLLEDDHYLMPDFVHMIKKMSAMRSNICGECNLFSLGNYKSAFHAEASGEVVINRFVSSRHNMAMAFNRSLFEQLKAHAREFCTYDDYNWDWTLQHIGKVHVPGDIVTLVPHLTRAFHMGQCGIHHVNNDCDPSSQVRDFQRQISQSRSHLFPQTLKKVFSVADISVPSTDPKENGGWGDPRDHELCMSFLSVERREGDPL